MMTNKSLPLWYASFNKEDYQSILNQKDKNENKFHCGPITIFNKDSGCEIYTFGYKQETLVIFDGFLFDKRNLINELKIESKNPSNSVIVSEAYKKWGEKLYEHLLGEFSISIWDSKEKTLFVGIDSLGCHQLYYSDQKDLFLFSSNPLSLAHSGQIERTPNKLALILIMMTSYPPHRQTCFKNIRKLFPGYYLKLRLNDSLKEIKYYDPNPNDNEWYSDKYTLKNYESLLVNAVQRCIDLKPDGIMLSGGIDSVVIGAIANEFTKKNDIKPLIACSAKSPPGYWQSNADGMQDMVASSLRMKQITSNVIDLLGDKNLIIESLNESSNFHSPTFVYWTAGYLEFWRHLKHNGMNVLLTGSGGDEWLGLHPIYSADLLLRSKIITLLQFIISEIRRGQNILDSLRYIAFDNGIRIIVRSIWKKMAPNHKLKRNILSITKNLPKTLNYDNEIKQDLIELIISRNMPELNEDNSFPKSYYSLALKKTWWNGFMANESEKNFFASSKVGLTFLRPYYDKDLVSFLSRVNPRLFIYRSRYKGLLRPIAKKYFPNFGLEKQKKLYPGENKDYSMSSLRENIKNAYYNFGCNSLNSLGIVDKNEIERIINNSENENFANLVRVYAILCSEVWVNENIKNLNNKNQNA